MKIIETLINKYTSVSTVGGDKKRKKVTIDTSEYILPFIGNGNTVRDSDGKILLEVNSKVGSGKTSYVISEILNTFYKI